MASAIEWRVMACGNVEVEALNKAVSSAQISETEPERADDGGRGNAGGCVEINCFSEAVNDVTLHFQITRLPRQASTSIVFECLKEFESF